MKITANGIDVHYRIEGEGPWITSVIPSLQIIPSAAHLSNIEQSQIFTEAVLGSLERVSRR